MEIREALDALSGLLDSLCAYGEYSDEELEYIGKVENTIYEYVRSKGDI
jgi:hypothetical protein